MPYDAALVNRILLETRQLVSLEMERIFTERKRTGYGPLYDMLEDYPGRNAKGLRPAICLAACRAVGGLTEQAILSATAIELFHNAALLHDDTVDGSDDRRGRPTMFREKGAGIAINVGDATNVLAMEPLLGNTERLGMRKALLILQEIERMARESTEGQAIELGWIADKIFDLNDRDYVRMAYKKTCWYTVIAPLRIGVLCGLAPGKKAPIYEDLQPLTELGFLAGIAFQISDDTLNLEADPVEYGKEPNGDLWEGKRTIMLLHFLRTTTNKNRNRALKILSQPRLQKKPKDIEWLLKTLLATGSLEYGRKLAREYSERALSLESGNFPFFGQNEDRKFLREMLNYVVDRNK